MKIRKWGVVENEGDKIFYKVTGEGPPLLLISGVGEGDLWIQVADILSDEYKVITYDRRANGRSTMNYPDKFDISQQGRDAIAVLNAVGESSAHILGDSSAAVITLDIATNYPEIIQTAIIYEAPLAILHHQSAKWFRFFRSCYNSAFKFGGCTLAYAKLLFGMEVAAIDMIKAQLRAKKYLNNEYSSEKKISYKLSTEYFIKQEMLPITNYNPDIETLKNSQRRIVVACGDYAISRGTWLGEVSRELAGLLSSEIVVFSGHHQSFIDNPTDWARDIMYILNNKNAQMHLVNK